ncbi:hypothetical protein DTO164E3_1935 [Paecilomyces variotii]|nr:hypothetical protein DTO032I3_7871 [Paecilomyces variotii]KAJ9204173.1 hypothetical protein DTO164E3_1935 [Paecilomyces variotii]KAJ9221801.1 hypothetical protein DTO169C6_5947 [Paecilomyces variotii]KAJ9230363.1 hypothetical protein DTO169E5_8480 [Paecilomyces variotii]KAJ9252610.1 hypothetical protein DTO207G8_4672 [Paecilomyces variotii]
MVLPHLRLVTPPENEISWRRHEANVTTFLLAFELGYLTIIVYWSSTGSAGFTLLARTQPTPALAQHTYYCLMAILEQHKDPRLSCTR